MTKFEKAKRATLAKWKRGVIAYLNEPTGAGFDEHKDCGFCDNYKKLGTGTFRGIDVCRDCPVYKTEEDYCGGFVGCDYSLEHCLAILIYLHGLEAPDA